MCLRVKYTKKQKEEWLKDKPEMITAYKVIMTVRTEEGKIKFYPLIFCDEPYKRINRLHTNKDKDKNISVRYKNPRRDETSYIAYYHLYADKEAAQRWTCCLPTYRKIIKCLIPKNLITEIGEEGYYHSKVIIAKGFEIVGEDEVFQEN